MRQDQVIVGIGNRVIEKDTFAFPWLGEIGGTVSRSQEDLATQGGYCVSVLRELCASSLQQGIAKKASPDVLMKENVAQPAETSASTKVVESLSRQVQDMEECNSASIIRLDRRLQELEAVHSVKEGGDGDSDSTGTATGQHSEVQSQYSGCKTRFKNFKAIWVQSFSQVSMQS